jgi:hypothetical protein
MQVVPYRLQKIPIQCVLPHRFATELMLEKLVKCFLFSLMGDERGTFMRKRRYMVSPPTCIGSEVEKLRVRIACAYPG